MQVRNNLRRKRAKKELEKRRERESVPVESQNKKKDTVWKIIMPGKDRKYATTTEERVVQEIEDLVDRQPLVQKSLKQLQELDDALASSKPSSAEKAAYTSKKNRISAQLSRDRRSAIVQSLMDLCVDNIERRENLEFELDEAKDVLKKTLCEECKTNLKAGTQKRKSGVTVRGKGKNAFLLSLLAVSVAMVAVVAPPKSAEVPFTGPVPTDI